MKTPTRLVVFGSLLTIVATGCGGKVTTGFDSGECPDASNSTCGPTSDAGPTPEDATADTGGTEEDTGPPPWTDRDEDGVPNKVDNCPATSNPTQDDGDSDGVGDGCDNCPKTANVDQTDSDGDGRGDLCSDGETYDPARDSDGDGIDDGEDNCVDTPNAPQDDPDGDGRGSKCDNCPQTDNPTQQDSDGNGTGDACEPKPAGKTCNRKTSDFQKVRPNIYFVIDRSSSMDDGRMTTAKNGLDKVANKLHDKARIGMSTFPCASESTDCGALNKEFLSVGKYSASKIIASYRSNYNRGMCPHGNIGPSTGLAVETGGKHCTETGSALKHTHRNRLHSDGNDPLDGKREKAVVLITDGGACGPNCGGNGQQSLAEKWAKKMHGDGISVYVVGYQTGAISNLNRIADKGGTDAGSSGGRKYYTASNASQLAGALGKISKKVISCQYKVSSNQGVDPNKLWVKIDGTYVAQSEYTYDTKNKTLKLSNSACTKLQNASTSGSSSPLEIVVGCPSKCSGSEEVCDFADNDCDGEIDEGCENCSPEVCDGADNDCDSAVDEGCPSCTLVGGTCSEAGSCCKGSCQDGTCKLCRPKMAKCRNDEQCCTGMCSASGGSIGRCVGG